MLASCCQMHFCEECLQDDPYDMRTYCEVECPRCKKYNVDVKFDEQMWAMIGQLKVKCSFIGRGCLWVGELGSRKTHTDPLTGDCEYAEKDCWHKCGKRFEDKNKLTKHMEEDCPKRPAICPHCNEKGEYDFISGKHKDECPITCIGSNMDQYPVDFVNNLPREFSCRHCKFELRRPMLTECCNKYYCASCIEDPYDWHTTTYNCPDCGQDDIAASIDNEKWKEILKLNVRCPLFNSGCPWIGELGARGAHLDLTTGDCEHVEIDCPDKCGQKVAKNDLLYHSGNCCSVMLVLDKDDEDDEDYNDMKELYKPLDLVAKIETFEPLNRKWDDIDLSEFLDPPSIDFICPACTKVFGFPMLTGCCSKHYCASCIKNPHYFIIEPDVFNKYQCPQCGETSQPAILDKFKWEKVLALRVKCPLADSGCLWIGQLGQRETHKDGKSGDYCDYTMLECQHKCGKSFERYKLFEHTETLCPRRPVTCEYCGMNGEQVVVSGEHKKDCPDIPTPCPNSCGIEPVKQKDLLQHLLECPEEIVECYYCYAGCTEQIQRKNLTEHLVVKSAHHLHLNGEFFFEQLHKKEELLQKYVAEKNDQFLKANNIFKQQIEELKIAIEEKYKETNRNTEELMSYLKQKYDDLEQHANQVIYSRWEIKRSDLNIELTKIDSKSADSDSVIKKWEGTYNDLPVVVKMLKPGISSVDFLQEARTLMKLDHSNIIKLHGIVSNSEPICIILERMDHGTLEQYLRSNDIFLLHQQISMCKQVAQGLDYLHQNLFIHRNIRAETIHVGDGLILKIGEFGSAIILEHYAAEVVIKENESVSRCNCSPEALKERKFSLKSDVWSYGTLIWEVITRSNSQSSITNVDEDVRLLTVNPAYALLSEDVEYVPQLLKCPVICYELMIQCLKQEPWIRPALNTVISSLVEQAEPLYDIPRS